MMGGKFLKCVGERKMFSIFISLSGSWIVARRMLSRLASKAGMAVAEADDAVMTSIDSQYNMYCMMSNVMSRGCLEMAILWSGYCSYLRYLWYVDMQRLLMLGNDFTIYNWICCGVSLVL